jgi:hypothetical protein
MIAMTVTEQLEAVIRKHPGLTESELAKTLYGWQGYAQQVNAACRQLVKLGKIERRGKGYSEPFTYYPVNG